MEIDKDRVINNLLNDVATKTKEAAFYKAGMEQALEQINQIEKEHSQKEE